MSRKELGKIQDVKVGFVGYQESEFGIRFTLGSKSWGVSTVTSAWSPSLMECNERCKWTETDRDNDLLKTIRYMDKLIHEAGVSDVYKLVGTPVEVEFDGTILKSWRILTEVL